MRITLKTNEIKLKDQNGNYKSPVVLADETTPQHIADVNAAITAKGQETIASIPSDYTTLSNTVNTLQTQVGEASSLDVAAYGSTALISSGGVYKTGADALGRMSLGLCTTNGGNITCAQLVPALLVEANFRKYWTVTDSGTTTEYFVGGAGRPINAGDKVCVLKNSTTQRISTASFMFKVVADTLDGLAEEANSYSDTIEQISANLEQKSSDLEMDLSASRVNNPRDIITTEVGFITIPYEMAVGKEYVFKNISSGDTSFNIRSKILRNGEVAETIVTPLTKNNSPFYFIPSQHTYYLYIYASGSGEFTVNELDSEFQLMKNDDAIYSNSKQNTCCEFDCKADWNTFYFPLKKGHLYALWNDVDGNAYNVFSRNQISGSNIQTLARPLTSKSVVVASDNTVYLRIYALNAGKLYIAEINEGNRVNNSGRKKIETIINTNSAAYNNNGTLAFTSDDSYFSHTMIPVSNGEQYELYGRSGGRKTAIFTNELLSVISEIDGTGTSENAGFKVTVPSGATRMYVNFSYATSTSAVYKVEKFITSDDIAKNNGHIVIEVDVNGGKDFTSLSEAVASIKDSCKNKIYDVIIYPGTYNVVAELGGETYINGITSYTGYAGIKLPDYVNLIGIGEVIITGIIPATYTWNKYANTSFSPINMNTGNHILKNLTVIAQNCRYAIHDDSSNEFNNWNKELINCKVIHNGNDEVLSNEGVWTGVVGYGMGHSEGSTLKATNCYFEGHGLPGFSCHDLNNFAIGANLIFIGCEFKNTNASAGNGDIKLGTVDSGGQQSICIMIGNKLKKMYLYDERSGSSGEENRWLVIGGGNSSTPIANTEATPITVEF